MRHLGLLLTVAAALTSLNFVFIHRRLLPSPESLSKGERHSTVSADIGRGTTIEALENILALAQKKLELKERELARALQEIATVDGSVEESKLVYLRGQQGETAIKLQAVERQLIANENRHKWIVDNWDGEVRNQIVAQAELITRPIIETEERQIQSELDASHGLTPYIAEQLPRLNAAKFRASQEYEIQLQELTQKIYDLVSRLSADIASGRTEKARLKLSGQNIVEQVDRLQQTLATTRLSAAHVLPALRTKCNELGSQVSTAKEHVAICKTKIDNRKIELELEWSKAERQRIANDASEKTKEATQPTTYSYASIKSKAPASAATPRVSSTVNTSFPSQTYTSPPTTGSSQYYDPGYRPAVGEHWVNPSTDKNGVYRQGHWRSNPDDSYWNNTSSFGNTNPHTGSIGTKIPRAGADRASTTVKPYYRSDGTYVKGHVRRTK